MASNFPIRYKSIYHNGKYSQLVSYITEYFAENFPQKVTRQEDSTLKTAIFTIDFPESRTTATIRCRGYLTESVLSVDFQDYPDLHHSGQDFLGKGLSVGNISRDISLHNESRITEISTLLLNNREKVQSEFIDMIESFVRANGLQCSKSERVSCSYIPDGINFTFQIYRTPYQFCNLLQYLFPLLKNQPEYSSLNFYFLGKDDRILKIINSETANAKIKILLENFHCQIIAQAITFDKTVLDVHIQGSDLEWKLWDCIRDEMYEKGWLSHTISQTSIFDISSKNGSDCAGLNLIPGLNFKENEIISYWRQGLSAKEIGKRLSMQPHSVNNKVCELRREYGEDLVPNRK